MAAGLSAGFLLSSDNDSHGEDMARPVDVSQVEQVIVFLDQEVTDQQLSDLETAIADHPAVASFTYWDQASSADEYRRIFADNQEMLDWLEANPDGLPTSYRIVPTETGAPTIRELTTAFENEPGVLRVTAPTDRDDWVSPAT